jgi:RimJ/RimL family protein N-acetyltransferase
VITFRITTDLGYVRAVFTHPDVWPFVCDDAHPGPEHFVPLEHDSVVYLVPESDGEPMGVVMLQAQGAVAAEMHSALLPAFRGKPAVEAFRALLAYLPGAFPAVKYLRTWVPAFNRPALLAARRVGFVERGVEPLAYLKHGALCDHHLFGVTLSCQ